MIPDNNLIAYEYYKNQYTPSAIYPSGEKDEDKTADKYSKRKELPVLILEDDIVNPEGYGLLRGFYNVAVDEGLEFLLIYQKGELKAKVPVVKMKITAQSGGKQEKPKRMSERKYKKQQEKEYRKYLKGENPNDFEYKSAQIHYIEEQQGWILIYNFDNKELYGMIKF